MADSLRGDADHRTVSSQSSKNRTASSVEEKFDYDASSLEKIEASLNERFPHINERKMLWKMDLRIVGLVFIMNFFTFLDRVNISNAALFGLKQDLGLVGNQYNTILTIYFIPYILCDIPANMLLKKFRPRIWLPLCAFGFGFMTIMEGLTRNFGGMMTARFFLGMFECAIFPGCIYYISMWYTRAEAQTRFTLFFSSNTLAGSFAGLLGYAIGHMDGMRGLRGWRWIFILEGTLSCLVALSFFFLVSDFPEEAKWLSEDEKAFVKARLQDDVGKSGRSEKITATHFVNLLKDYKTYLGAFMYFGLIVPAYSFAYFAPSIILGYGHSAIQTQLLSIPPYACAFVFSMTISALSDRLRHRFAFTMLGTVIGIIGFGILFNVHNKTNTEYAALFLAATGTYTAMPLALCWFGMNVQSHAQRSLATGFQIGFGNTGGIVASYSFLANQAPQYLTGYSICISFSCLSALATVLYSLAIRAERNKANKLANSEASDNLYKNLS